MNCLRILIREHRHLAMAFLVLAFCIRAAIPSGFMVSASADTVLTIKICSGSLGEPQEMQLVVAGKKDQGSGHSDSGNKGGHCAFSGLSQAALGGADAILLALAFAFILVLGLAPVQRLPFRQFAYVRPPLRGPPTIA